MIALDKISVAFGARDLFKDVRLRFGLKEKVAIVGANGTGKSTLLKIICGIYEPDSGSIIKSKHTTVGYLPQETVVLSGKTLYEEVYSSAGDIKAIQNEISEIETELKEFEDQTSEEYLDLIQELHDLQVRFALLEGYQLNAKVEKILKGLGFSESDFKRQTEEFSGGWQMRIALAKLLLQNPNVLLLDEPTNHLDMDSLVWLENYLKSYSGTIILVSHDRKFLDNLATRTIELSNGVISEYAGNYSYYKMEKEKRREITENQFKNRQKYIKEQEKFIERFRYKATKAKAVQSRIKMLEKLDEIELEEDESSVRFTFPPATHSGKITYTIEKLKKSYDGKKFVLDGIDLIITRGEKIALVGANGAGKSTLSRILAGLESYQSGKVEQGHFVETKYFAQNQAEELNPEMTVLETMESASTSGEVYKSLRTILGGFLFHGDDVFKPVGVLSGGEKSRLALAKMLIEPSNFLILDEPTNHLDMRSKDVLMNALKKYQGTILVVSHDREFLDGFITKIVEVKSGNIKTYNCSMKEFSDIKENELKELKLFENQNDGYREDMQEEGNTKNELTPYERGIEIKKRKKELTKEITPLKKRINEIESELLKNETRKSEIEEIMSSEDFYKNAEKSIELKKEYSDILENIEHLNKKWDFETEKLNILLKQISNIN